MKLKREIPVWAMVASVAVAFGFVAMIFIRGGGGEASKEELTEIRSNQRKFSSPAPPVEGTPATNSEFRSR